MGSPLPSSLLLLVAVSPAAAFRTSAAATRSLHAFSSHLSPSPLPTPPTPLKPPRSRTRTLLALQAFKPEIAQATLGLAAQPIMWWSLYTLKTTGCGLPAGPYGLFGALEGVSYLIVAGFVLASLYSKLTTGSGLPAGEGGLLGAAEGLSFLTATAGLAVLGFQVQSSSLTTWVVLYAAHEQFLKRLIGRAQVFDYGYIPNAVPVEGGVCS